jgi:uncharacterized protein
MSYDRDVAYSRVAIQAEPSERAVFIRRTYAHLAGAILAFVALEFLLFKVLPSEFVRDLLVSMSYSPLIVMLAFLGASFLAQSLARSESSQAIQYVGLGLYVVVWAVIFVPILYYSMNMVGDPYLIPTAGILTLCVFGGLTAAVFITRKDYSFLAPFLTVASFLALGLIIVACIWPGALGGLGTWFSFAMVALMSGYILMQTSAIMLHYRTDQHVAAALALFSSVATLFFYILRILGSRR